MTIIYNCISITSNVRMPLEATIANMYPSKR